MTLDNVALQPAAYDNDRSTYVDTGGRNGTNVNKYRLLAVDSTMIGKKVHLYLQMQGNNGSYTTRVRFIKSDGTQEVFLERTVGGMMTVDSDYIIPANTVQIKFEGNNCILIYEVKSASVLSPSSTITSTPYSLSTSQLRTAKNVVSANTVGDSISEDVATPNIIVSNTEAGKEVTIDSEEKYKKSDKDVYIKLPEFSYDYASTLNPYLQNLGIKKAFLPDADFSGVEQPLLPRRRPDPEGEILLQIQRLRLDRILPGGKDQDGLPQRQGAGFVAPEDLRIKGILREIRQPVQHPGGQPVAKIGNRFVSEGGSRHRPERLRKIPRRRARIDADADDRKGRIRAGKGQLRQDAADLFAIQLQVVHPFDVRGFAGQGLNLRAFALGDKLGAVYQINAAIIESDH